MKAIGIRGRTWGNGKGMPEPPVPPPQGIRGTIASSPPRPSPPSTARCLLLMRAALAEVVFMQADLLGAGGRMYGGAYSHHPFYNAVW
jgi:hypothetical protein